MNHDNEPFFVSFSSIAVIQIFESLQTDITFAIQTTIGLLTITYLIVKIIEKLKPKK